MDTEILPCPCCGSRASYCATPDDSDVAGAYYIECTNRNCQLTTPLVFACGDDPKPHLLSKWNNRKWKQCRFCASGDEPILENGRWQHWSINGDILRGECADRTGVPS